jgi:hypothetical protein
MPIILAVLISMGEVFGFMWFYFFSLQEFFGYNKSAYCGVLEDEFGMDRKKL